MARMFFFVLFQCSSTANPKWEQKCFEDALLPFFPHHKLYKALPPSYVLFWGQHVCGGWGGGNLWKRKKKEKGGERGEGGEGAAAGVESKSEGKGERKKEEEEEDEEEDEEEEEEEEAE